MTAPEDDYSRLPKWAQRRLEMLEESVASLRAHLEAGPDDSDTFADPYYDSPRPLGNGTMIRFGDSEGAFYVHLEDGALSVTAQSMWASELVIKPRSDNSVRLEMPRRKR